MNKFFCNLLCTSDDYKSALPRLIVGLIFLSEGIQKFLFPSLGILRFEKIGFAHPGFLASFVATFEIFCGSMVLAGFLIRLAVIPLFIIIVTAIIRTKIPLMTDQGFWAMAHEARTDFAMTLLNIYLYIFGAGKLSFDSWMIKKKNQSRSDI